MFFPARIGDTVTHDGVTPCGVIAPAPGPAPTLIIEGLPAATVGCLVACTGLTAFGPAHPPMASTLVGGCSTLLVGGMPAARWAPSPDLTSCGALLGDPKLAATRTVKVGP